MEIKVIFLTHTVQMKLISSRANDGYFIFCFLTHTVQMKLQEVMSQILFFISS